MEGKAEALLLWLHSATKSEPASILQLRNCRLIQQLLSQIEGFLFPLHSATSSEWKDNYAKMKTIYQQVEIYMKQTLKISPPSSLSVMNLVEMAKGESEEGLQTLLHLVFIVCIRCPNKDDFIQSVLQLPSTAQVQLMQIIKDWATFQEETKEDNSEVAYYKQELLRLEFLNQNLYAENNSLKAILEEDNEKARRNEEKVSYLIKQNQQLQHDLSERNEQLRLRQENFLDKYAQHNEDLVQELKKTLMQREQQYGKEIYNLKETIYSLQESLGEAKRQSSELQEEQSRRSMMQSRDEHINCISIEKHKSKINQLLSASKEATQREISIKLENIQLKNTNAELESKLKKIQEQNRKKESQFMITSEDSSKLKIEFFTRVRDSLRQKFTEYKSKDNRGSGNNLEFLDEQS